MFVSAAVRCARIGEMYVTSDQRPEKKKMARGFGGVVVCFSLPYPALLFVVSSLYSSRRKDVQARNKLPP